MKYKPRARKSVWEGEYTGEKKTCQVLDENIC